MVVIVEVLVIDVLADVGIMIAGVIVIVLKSALSVSYSVEDESPDIVVDLFMDVLMLGVLADIGIEVLVDVNPNTFVVAMTVLELPVSAPLEDFSS